MAITPKGLEPENIKRRMDTLFLKLDAAYPDKVIISLAKEHGKWAEAVTELYRALGYPDGTAFLEAHGYTVQKGKSGRPQSDLTEIIREIQRRYPNGSPFCKMNELQEANKDLGASLKTLMNRAHELFGMSLADYLQSIGILKTRDFQKELEDLVAQLRLRYPDPNHLPKTVSEIKKNNSDLPMERLVYATRLNMTVAEYLQKAGVLQAELKKKRPQAQFAKEPLTDEVMQQYIAILQQRYEGKELPNGIREVAAENTDLAVNRIHLHLRKTLTEPVENFYIRNRILQGLPTDMNTYTLYNVKLDRGQTIWTIGDSKRTSLQVGDCVHTSAQWLRHTSGGVVQEIYTGLGLDAPCPIKDIQAHCLGLERSVAQFAKEIDSTQEISKNFDKVNIRFPKLRRDWEKTDMWGDPFYMLAQIRFRGYPEEVNKLIAYLRYMNVEYEYNVQLGGIWEVCCMGDDLQYFYPEIIQNIPALKVTGLLEGNDWYVYAFFSESGANGITACDACTTYDLASDAPDDRWACTIDMTKNHHHAYIYIKTNDRVRSNYSYPYLKQWNDDNYLREKDGEFYRMSC